MKFATSTLIVAAIITLKGVESGITPFFASSETPADMNEVTNLNLLPKPMVAQENMQSADDLKGEKAKKDLADKLLAEKREAAKKALENKPKRVPQQTKPKGEDKPVKPKGEGKPVKSKGEDKPAKKPETPGFVDAAGKYLKDVGTKIGTFFEKFGAKNKPADKKPESKKPADEKPKA